MRFLVEVFLKLLPIAAVVLLCYVLFIAPDTAISEGMRLSVSALLGAIASYTFIAYAQFVEKIELRKAKHRNALANLEFKLNEQLSWLSDVIFHMSGHERILKKVIDGQDLIVHDATAYREPISIESEIYDLANLSFKNDLLSLLTLYRKLQNDISSHQQAYAFMINSALNKHENLESYMQGIPTHLERTQLLRQHTMDAVRRTKLSLSKCRVLSSNNNSLIVSLVRFLIQQPTPKGYELLVNEELKALEEEIVAGMARAQAEMNEIKKT